MEPDVPPLQVTLKTASRCNLDCTYCYVYHKADDSWRARPAVMSDEVLEAAIRRIRRHCLKSGQSTVDVLFHGGEPCLMGVARFRRWCDRIREALQDVVRVRFVIQTNGVLLDARWIAAFKEQGCNIGVSLDGPQAVHDQARIDHHGVGSFKAVMRGIEALQAADVSFSILTVVTFGSDGAEVQAFLEGLAPTSVEYILPDFTHDTIAEVRRRFGPTPCADVLIPAFDAWWFKGTLGVSVSPFTHAARAILGGRVNVDFIGNNPLGYLFVETDGAIEGLDVLKVCDNGLSAAGLNVFDHDFTDLREASPLHGRAIFQGMPLPTGCRACPERETCAGGYLPHRYSRADGFDNPSVWCADWLKMFAHLRARLGVDGAETGLRRQALEELARERRTEEPEAAPCA